MTIQVLTGLDQVPPPIDRRPPGTPEGFQWGIHGEGLECDSCGYTIDWIGMSAQEAAQRHREQCKA